MENEIQETNDKVSDLLYILEQIEHDGKTSFEKSCVLSNIEQFFYFYQDKEINGTLLNLFQEKFKA